MPFTFAHIGYVLPIKMKLKKYFSVTGLVFGSLAPDYDILFRLTKVRIHIFQYDAKAIILYIFPLALISAIFYHLICRNIIIDHLPKHYELKYKKYKSFDFIDFLKKKYLVVSWSIIFAILLHLLLDFLCHCVDAHAAKVFINKHFHDRISDKVIFGFSIYSLPILFSIVGFYLIYRYELTDIFSIKNIALTKQKVIFWCAFFLITILLYVIKYNVTEVDKEFFIDFVIISLTSSFIIAVYATCLVYQLIKKLK